MGIMSELAIDNNRKISADFFIGGMKSGISEVVRFFCLMVPVVLFTDVTFYGKWAMNSVPLAKYNWFPWLVMSIPVGISVILSSYVAWRHPTRTRANAIEWLFAGRAASLAIGCLILHAIFKYMNNYLAQLNVSSFLTSLPSVVQKFALSALNTMGPMALGSESVIFSLLASTVIVPVCVMILRMGHFSRQNNALVNEWKEEQSA